jgi:putrescine aminotransferase
VFICSTGAEAVESALKLVRLSKRKSEIIAAKGGFHGFTMGALSVSGIPQQTKLFQPLLPDISFVDYGDINAIHAVVSDKTAAIVLEPVQAEIGGIAPPKNYLREVREICDRHDVLLVVDEVRTGIGRTGPLFCIEDEQVVPDILAVGKSLAGGIVPIGAIVAKQEIWSRFGYSFSMSASSFAGNRLACIAAIETLNVIEVENILNGGVENARILWNICNDIQRENEDILERITGKGMLLGLHFTSPKIANEIVRKSIMRGVLIGTAFCNNRCILLEPPLNISGDNLVMALETLKSVVQDKR